MNLSDVLSKILNKNDIEEEVNENSMKKGTKLLVIACSVYILKSSTKPIYCKKKLLKIF